MVAVVATWDSRGQTWGLRDKQNAEAVKGEHNVFGQTTALSHSKISHLSVQRGCCPCKGDVLRPIHDTVECGRTLQLSTDPFCWFMFPKTQCMLSHTYTLFLPVLNAHTLAAVTFPNSLARVSLFHHSLSSSAAPHCSRCSHRCNSNRARIIPHEVTSVTWSLTQTFTASSRFFVNDSGRKGSRKGKILGIKKDDPVFGPRVFCRRDEAQFTYWCMHYWGSG